MIKMIKKLNGNVLLLDLEGTLIDNIYNLRYLQNNIKLINNYIIDNEIDNVVIFSHAISNDEDFYKLKNLISIILNNKNFSYLSITDCINILYENCNYYIENIFDFYLTEYTNKILFIIKTIDIIAENNTHIILIDDSFKPIRVRFTDNRTFKCIKIKNGEFIYA